MYQRDPGEGEGGLLKIICAAPKIYPKMEFKEFEPRFKSANTRFKLSAGLNLETNFTQF